MRLFFFCLILLLPAAGALGFDLWHFYKTLEEGHDLPFQFSEVGYLLVTYAKDVHDWLHDSIDPALWETTITPVLRLPAVLAGLAPAAVVYLVLFICWLFGLWPFNTAGSVKVKSQPAALGRGKHGSSFKYKRK